MSETRPPDEAGRTRRAVLANLRHELRTPLNAVIGYSEMLLEDIAEGEGPEALYPKLSQIQSAGNELLDLVNDALHPDRESPRENLRRDLRPPMEAVIVNCEALREEANALDQADILPDLQKIHSSAGRFLDLTDSVDDFSRTEGDGLPDLSVEAPDVPDVVPKGVPPEAAGVRTGQNPLLIVDDNGINRDVLARHLGRQGYATATAENGRLALEMVRMRKFDLVLLDIMMPEMNGYEVLRRLKSDPGLRDIPVIMISALDDMESVVRCIEMGAEDYLPKPFDPVLLRARIGACLEKKHLRDQEIEYLRNVDYVTAAAADVEAEEFDPGALAQVAGRDDELGQLARVFQRMAREVRAREQRLKQEVQQLRIEIDESRTAHQVAEITETDYFRDLQSKADRLRSRANP